jgi:UMF1 family MFS transporter
LGELGFLHDRRQRFARTLLTSLAQASVGENGVIFNFGSLGAVTAKNLFSLSVTISVFCQVLFLPLLGAVADYSNLKKRLMAFFLLRGRCGEQSFVFRER